MQQIDLVSCQFIAASAVQSVAAFSFNQNSHLYGIFHLYKSVLLKLWLVTPNRLHKKNLGLQNKLTLCALEIGFFIIIFIDSQKLEKTKCHCTFVVS